MPVGSGHFTAPGAREGVPFPPTGTVDEYREARAHPDLAHPRKGLRLLREPGVQPRPEPTVAWRLDRVRDGETRTVTSTLGLAARCRAKNATTQSQQLLLLPAVAAACRLAEDKFEGSVA